MDATDVMTHSPMTIAPSTSVRRIAEIMSERRISGLPVVDDAGKLIGIVTEGDLIRRAELGTERKRGGLLETLFSASSDVEDFIAANGKTAADVMTNDVVAVAPDATLRQIAHLFATRGIRRVPVVDNDKVVGVVSRADLVHAIAAKSVGSERPTLSDRQIRDLVLAEFRRHPFSARTDTRVFVLDGVVTLWGFAGSENDHHALRLIAEGIPGVKVVEHQPRRPLPAFGIDPLPSHRLTVVARDENE